MSDALKVLLPVTNCVTECKVGSFVSGDILSNVFNESVWCVCIKMNEGKLMTDISVKPVSHFRQM